MRFYNFAKVRNTYEKTTKASGDPNGRHAREVRRRTRRGTTKVCGDTVALERSSVHPQAWEPLGYFRNGEHVGARGWE